MPGNTRWEDRNSSEWDAHPTVTWTKEEWIAATEPAPRGPSPNLLGYVATLSALAGSLHLWMTVGPWAAAAVPAAAVGLVTWWRHLHRPSFDRLVLYPARAAWRRRWVYGPRWNAAMDRAGLGCYTDVVGGRRQRPRIVRTFATADADEILAELLPRQTVADVGCQAADLALSFNQAGCLVTVDRPATRTYPARVWLRFPRTGTPTLPAGSSQDNNGAIQVQQLSHRPSNRTSYGSHAAPTSIGSQYVAGELPPAPDGGRVPDVEER